MYTWDHERDICEVNRAIYPYFDLLEKMKAKADSMIIATYSKEFFENHVRFNFHFSAYDKGGGYVGTWTEPLQGKPTQFLFRYDVKLKTSGWYTDMMEFELDSVGKYIPGRGLWSNYGFENVKSQRRTFEIDKNKAVEIAKEKGFVSTASNEVSEFLFWEKYKTYNFYNGEFRYYITLLTEEIKDIKKRGRSSIVYKYDVCSFNPWTGEFIEMKKMKRIKEWEKLSGSTSGLMPDE